ncbi:MAG: hypothetical protein ACI4QR_05920 [Eubacteriales bacterium]
MENTDKIKDTISSIDDETLKLKIENIMQALGISPSAVGQKFNDVSFIRKTVMGMSEDDMKNILSTIGEDKAQEILQEINRK